ncbi:MAG: REP-associated tyrosine transposase [Fimbriiglobus sp.]
MNDSHGKHLRRLRDIWPQRAIYFVTTCVHQRQRILATPEFHDIAVEVWGNCHNFYGWATGRYVIMPDHVHFIFAEDSGQHDLSFAVGKWKEWTAKYASRRLGFPIPLWQPEFFDFLLRNPDSYEQKWDYTRENPVRAGLVDVWSKWTFQGELNDIYCESENP